MIVYLILLLVIMVLAFLSNKVKGNGKNIIIFLIFLSLSIISGIRYNVGADYLSYQTFFNYIGEFSNSDYEIGYYLLNYILKFLFNNSVSVFLVTSMIINYFICKMIKDNDNHILSYFIYICGTLFFFGLNGIRQTIAMSLFYYSLKFIKTKDFKKYLICNLIGILFHISSIIFIPLYFVLDKPIKNKKKIIILIIAFLLSNSIVKILSNVLLNSRYSFYILKSEYYIKSTLNISSIINFLILILYSIFTDKNDKNNCIFENIHLIAAIISILMPYLPLANRLFMSFRYIEFLSVPNLLKNLSLKNKKIGAFIKFMVYVLYFYYFIHGVYMENGNKVLPYKTIFDK